MRERDVWLGLGALALGLGLWMARREKPAPQPEPEPEPEYPDIQTDVYLMGIETESGDVEVEGKFPFFGHIWGGFSRGNDD